VLEALEAEVRHQRERVLADRFPVLTEQLGAEDDVVDDRPPGEEQVLLEHVADLAGRPDDRPAVEQRLAARRPDQPGDDVEDRRLPAAARPDDADELALLDVEADVTARDDALASGDLEDLLDPAQLDLRRVSDRVTLLAARPGCERTPRPLA
jgi:hypothetical protein